MWDELWLKLVDSTGFDDRMVFVLGTWLVHFTAFWGFNAILTAFYHFNLFPQYRILKGAMPPKELVNEALFHIVFNHFVTIPIMLYLTYNGFVSFGMQIRAPLPSVGIIARDFLVSIVINDTLFYWGHRTMHHPSIYKYIHKQHHKFNKSIGIAAEYAHPLEDLLCNTLPTIGGCLLMGSHVVTLWLWLFLRVVETVDTHSGYSWPFYPFHIIPFIQGGAERHDFHHSHNLGCYGSFTIFWDHVMGTDADFKKHQQKLKEA